jgi:hypothetical protein
MSSRLSFVDVDFNLEGLDLETDQHSTVDILTRTMTGNKKKSSPKPGTLRDASIDAIAELIKSGQGTFHFC